jgi:hypothetical protein
MGHRFGDSPQTYGAVEMADKQIGRIWEAIQYRQKHNNEDWIIFITTDHGRDEQSGKNHGGQSARQRTTWMVTNYRPLNDYARYFTPGIIDITPSITNYLQVKIPEAQLREMDGTSLIGPVSVVMPQVNYIQGDLDVTWKALDKKGKVKIWVASTNNFKDGNPDKYEMLAEVPVADQHALVSVKNLSSNIYKVYIEAPYNTVNRWFIISK